MEIEIGDLYFDYEGRPALRGVNLSVGQGEKVGLVGPNGAGKSTLLLCLDGLLQARGTVRIGGLVLTPKSAPEIRKMVGLVFADPEDQLFMPTLEEDVAFGPLNLGLPRRQAKERALKSLATLGLAEQAGRCSHHLADGERRRAAIATVLAMQPRVWLLDEPAANLDPFSRVELVKIMREIDGTVLVASHDLDLIVQTCSRCVVLDGGRVVADGQTSAVLGNAELMASHRLEVPLRLLLQKA